MTSRTRTYVLGLSTAIMVFAFVGGYLGQALTKDDTYQHLRVFEDVVSLVLNNYVEPVDVRQAMQGAMRGLADGLDPESSYLTPGLVKSLAKEWRDRTVRIVNLLARCGTDFRVVGPTAPVTEKGGEWGVECLDTKQNIWGIQFPPADPAGNEFKALLECRTCRTVSLEGVSLVEVEVLGTSGIVSRSCGTCAKVTFWGHAEKLLAPSAAVVEAATQALASGPERRRHRRLSLQLRARIRDYHGGVEILKSENISKGGLCFVSEKQHHLGAGILVVCPYDPAGENIEVRGRIDSGSGSGMGSGMGTGSAMGSATGSGTGSSTSAQSSSLRRKR